MQVKGEAEKKDRERERRKNGKKYKIQQVCWEL